MTMVDAQIMQDGGVSDAVDFCYRERSDRANDVMPEATGLVFGIGSPAVICGDLAVDHGTAAQLDIDRFELTAVAPSVVAVRVGAPGALGLERLEVIVGPPSAPLARARVIGGIGVALVAVPIGAHTVSVVARGEASAAIPYRVTIAPDEPIARCPPLPLPFDYMEPDEATMGHRRNDVVSVLSTPLTAMATPTGSDRPDDTMRAVSSDGRVVVGGSSANVTPSGDDYHDRDTFAVYAGQTTNFLEVRAEWVTSADLDVLVFEADKPGEPLGTPTATVTGELVVTAVKPSTLYWIWVGGSTRSAALPTTYRVAICGRELTPDAP